MPAGGVSHVAPRRTNGEGSMVPGALLAGLGTEVIYTPWLRAALVVRSDLDDGL
jgi:hypothetical protein